MDLVSEGEQTGSVYVITEGWACRYKTTRGGGRQVTGLAIPGDLCNLDSFLLPQVDFGVRMLTAATVVGLPRAQVQALATERPGVARAFTWFAVLENAILSQWVLSLGRRSARARLAHLLCELSIRLDGQYESQASFELPITQEQISDAIGLTSVHVNRTMQQLRSERLIAYQGRQFTILDKAALHRAGEFDGSYLHATSLPDIRSLAGKRWSPDFVDKGERSPEAWSAKAAAYGELWVKAPQTQPAGVANRSPRTAIWPALRRHAARPIQVFR